MDDAKATLTAAIDDLLQKSTFSLDAIEGIRALQQRAALLESQLAALTKRSGELAPIAARVQQSETNLGIAEKMRDAAIAGQQKLDKEQAVAVAKAEVYRECFALVFRNTEFRRSMTGAAPQSSASPSGNMPYTVPVSESVTQETL